MNKIIKQLTDAHACHRTLDMVCALTHVTFQQKEMMDAVGGEEEAQRRKIALIETFKSDLIALRMSLLAFSDTY